MPSSPVSALSPLRFAAFRDLWLMWFISNTSLWMWSVAAAWMMVDLRASPLLVALVQAATSLPMLLLGLPFGALADSTDRRRLLLVSQGWILLVAIVQTGIAVSSGSTPAALLAATFAYGCGVAMRNPTYHATMPGLVPPAHLPPALALNAVAMNMARIAGPLLAGLVIGLAGSDVVFGAVCVLSLLSIQLVRQWRPEPQSTGAAPLSLLESMRNGLAYVRGSVPFRTNLLRIAVYCGSVTGLPALLPLLARDIDGHGPSTFSLLFAAMGVGSVMSMAILQRLRARFTRDRLEMLGAAVHGATMIALSFTHWLPLAFALMLIAGVAWIVAANSMTIATQRILPDEVRARGMAIHQMVLMASIAVGSACWGQVATTFDVRSSLAMAGALGLVAVAAVVRAWPDPVPTPEDGVHRH